MNDEINTRMQRVIGEIVDNDLDETFALKIRALSDLMRAENTRMELGGKPDEKACRTFARILDKFSAQLLEMGFPEEECEFLNLVANNARKAGSE